MEYENRFNGRKNYYDIIGQFKMVRKYLYDEKTELYYHAYDEYKERDWQIRKQDFRRISGCVPLDGILWLWWTAMSWQVKSFMTQESIRGFIP